MPGEDKLKKAVRQKRYRERKLLKCDYRKVERERAKKVYEKKKENMTMRDQRHQRRNWRKAAREYRLRRRQHDNLTQLETSLTAHVDLDSSQNSKTSNSSSVIMREVATKREHMKLRRKLEKLRSENHNLKKRFERCKKKLQRSKAQEKEIRKRRLVVLKKKVMQVSSLIIYYIN